MQNCLQQLKLVEANLSPVCLTWRSKIATVTERKVRDRTQVKCNKHEDKKVFIM